MSNSELLSAEHGVARLQVMALNFLYNAGRSVSLSELYEYLSNSAGMGDDHASVHRVLSGLEEIRNIRRIGNKKTPLSFATRYRITRYGIELCENPWRPKIRNADYWKHVDARAKRIKIYLIIGLLLAASIATFLLLN